MQRPKDRNWSRLGLSAEQHSNSDSDGDVFFKRKKTLHKVKDDVNILHWNKVNDSGNFTVLPGPVVSMMSQDTRTWKQPNNEITTLL